MTLLMKCVSHLCIERLLALLVSNDPDEETAVVGLFAKAERSGQLPGSWWLLRRMLWGGGNARMKLPLSMILGDSEHTYR